MVSYRKFSCIHIWAGPATGSSFGLFLLNLQKVNGESGASRSVLAVAREERRKKIGELFGRKKTRCRHCSQPLSTKLQASICHSLLLPLSLSVPLSYFQELRMAKGLIWATAEDLARNRGKVLSLYRQILRSLNSPDLPLTYAARLSKKAEVRTIFIFGSEERSLHNIADLIDTAEYSLSILKKEGSSSIR
ncbi:hypothetical protein M5K25_027224 [Dendrobium thyrsiflorum]|uniref:LYR motif containing domain-containing protein n=1 Tax=Dendrobium thyrsiflorum TaxID=117978 RepID=A0ABD0TZG4_DENTH